MIPFAFLFLNPKDNIVSATTSNVAKDKNSGVDHLLKNLGKTSSTCFLDVQFNNIYETSIFHSLGNKSSYISPNPLLGGTLCI